MDIIDVFSYVIPEFALIQFPAFLIQPLIEHVAVVFQRKLGIDAQNAKGLVGQYGGIGDGTIRQMILFPIEILIIAVDRFQQGIELHFSKGSPALLVGQNVLQRNDVTGKLINGLLCLGDTDHLFIDCIEDLIGSLMWLDQVGIDAFGKINEAGIHRRIEIGKIPIQRWADLKNRSAQFIIEIVGFAGIIQNDQKDDQYGQCKHADQHYQQSIIAHHSSSLFR